MLDVDVLLDGCDDGDGGDDPDADYEDDDNDDECDYEDDDGISLKGGRNGSTNLWTLIKRRDGWMRRFRRNGACVDLSSVPFGWEEEGGHYEEDDVDDTADRDDDDDDARCSDSLFRVTIEMARDGGTFVRRHRPGRVRHAHAAAARAQRRTRRPIPEEL